MSKQVTDRQRSSRAVVAAIEQHKKAIADAQRALLSDAAGRLGRPTVDVGEYLDQCAETLKYGTELLTAASEAHTQEGLDDGEPRERRDRADRALRDYLTPIRKTVDGIYGDSGLRALGFWEPLPAAVDALVGYAKSVVTALKRPGLVLTPVLPTAPAQFDVAAHAALLEPLVNTLSGAVTDVARESAELGATLIAKNQAMEINDRNFMSIAGIVERMARGAGLGEVADRIRPSTANPGVLIEVPTEEELAKPAPAVDAPPPVRPRGMGPGFDPLDPEEPEDAPTKK